MNGSTLRAWLAALAIFFLGLAVGGVGVIAVVHHVVRRAIQNPGAGRFIDRATERVGNDLTRDLQLSPDDAAKVKSILADTAGNLKGIRRQSAQQVSAEIRATVRRLAEALPAEKRPELYRLVARRYEKLGLPAPLPDDAK